LFACLSTDTGTSPPEDPAGPPRWMRSLQPS
jgi:hypothetical protein